VDVITENNMQYKQQTMLAIEQRKVTMYPCINSLVACLMKSTETNAKCEMLPLETKHSRGKLLPHLDLRGGVFLGETPCGNDYRQKQKTQNEHNSFKIGTWNVRTLNQGGKLENL
jgi:hypothetical protein